MKKEGTSKTVLKIFSLFWRSSCRSTLLCSRKFCSNRRCQLCSKDETRAQNAAPDETRQALNFEKFDMEERHKEGPLSQFGGGKNVRFESPGTWGGHRQGQKKSAICRLFRAPYFFVGSLSPFCRLLSLFCRLFVAFFIMKKVN